MLIPMSVLLMLELTEEGEYIAPKGLDLNEIKQIVAYDEDHLNFYGTHLVTNYQELRTRLKTMDDHN